MKRKKKWIAIRTIWPYEDGWGAYCEFPRTLLSSGLSKEAAQKECDKLNRRGET